MHSLVQPDSWIFLRLTSSSLKIVQAVPNTTITLPKYGSFSTNLILSRPYFLTYELLDRLPSQKNSLLRVVPTSELHADSIAEEDENTSSEQIRIKNSGDHEYFGYTDETALRSNRDIIDSASRQTLTMAEIEELKKEGTGAGKDLIEKLITSHVGIEQKTSFSLAKYKLLKKKKYLKRFMVLPVDVPLLTLWITQEKDASKILEIREEMLALIGSWANVHFSSMTSYISIHANDIPNLCGRWLVVDETGGLLTASIAERMGILYPRYKSMSPSMQNIETHLDAEEDSSLSRTNTITLIHSNTQPNLSLLKYFSFIPDSQSISKDNGLTSHPLSTNLLLINWLQLLSPSQDITYSTPIPHLNATELGAMKSSRRATYYRKQRRWLRAKHVVSQTRRGGFDGLAVVSQMDPVSILKPLLPLLRGGAQVCIYSPYVEPLVVLADIFSTSRRTAFIQSQPDEHECLLNSQNQPRFGSPPPFLPENLPTSSSYIKPTDENIKNCTCVNYHTKKKFTGSADFPLNPTLLLNSTIQSARIREWQILPGRTHPMMTGRGGAEGYLFTAVRILPVDGHIEARGKYSKKRVVIEEQEPIEDKKLKVQ